MADKPEKRLEIGNLLGAFRAVNVNRHYVASSASYPEEPEKAPPLHKTAKLLARIRRDFPEYCGRPVVEELLALVSYLVDEAHLSGGYVSSEQYLRIFLIKFPDAYRAHRGSLFRRVSGA